MYEEYIRELNSTAGELLETLSRFSEDEFNRFPAPEKWSAGQMTDHVLQSVRGSYHLLAGPGKKAERPVDENLPKLKSIFLDFNKALKSPEFILPKNTVYEKDASLEDLRKTLDDMGKAAAEADLSMMCVNTLPVLGEMSKLEAIYFTIVHTQRHVRQAKRIYAEVVSV